MSIAVQLFFGPLARYAKPAIATRLQGSKSFKKQQMRLVRSKRRLRRSFGMSNRSSRGVWNKRGCGKRDARGRLLRRLRNNVRNKSATLLILYIYSKQASARPYTSLVQSLQPKNSVWVLQIVWLLSGRLPRHLHQLLHAAAAQQSQLQNGSRASTIGFSKLLQQKTCDTIYCV